MTEDILDPTKMFAFAFYDDSITGEEPISRSETLGFELLDTVHKILGHYQPTTDQHMRVVLEDPARRELRHILLDAALRGLTGSPLNAVGLEIDELFHTKYTDDILQPAMNGFHKVGSGWCGDRVEVDLEFEPSAALQHEDGEYLVLFWETDKCLRIHRFEQHWTGSVPVSITCTHGNPHSMTSGIWENAFYVLTDQLGVSIYNNDEDGHYTRFEKVNAVSAADKASTLDQVVRTWDDLEGATDNILSAYFQGFRFGAIDPLGADNPGYMIESMNVTAPAAVLNELRRLNPPTTFSSTSADVTH
jgi:hypothetical protein